MKSAAAWLGAAKLFVCASLAWTLTQQFEAYAGLGVWSEILVFLVMAPLIAFGAADALINDLLPEDYEAPKSRGMKYLVFVGIAASQMVWLYDAVIAYRLDFSAFRYALDALVATGVAMLDFKVQYTTARQRHEDENPIPAEAST